MASRVSKAIGRRSGDYIELSNQWARVRVTFYGRDDYREGNKALYLVDGDTLHGKREMRSSAIAMAYALNSLAAYEAGRAD